MSGFSLSERTVRACNAIHEAFGSFNDYGHDTAEFWALFELYRLGTILARRTTPDDFEPLEDRLAACLADCIDTTLLTVRDVGNSCPINLRLGSFDQALGERAATLLEEAGR